MTDSQVKAAAVAPRRVLVLHDRPLVVDLVTQTLNHGVFVVRAARTRLPETGGRAIASMNRGRARVSTKSGQLQFWLVIAGWGGFVAFAWWLRRAGRSEDEASLRDFNMDGGADHADASEVKSRT